MACDPQPASPPPEPAPDLQLQNISALGSIRLHQYRGRTVVLNVWATWCPPCRREMPALQALSHQLRSEGIAVLGLSADQDRFLAQEFLAEQQITFRNFIDRDAVALDALSISALPETLIINRDGDIVIRVIGERDWASSAMIENIRKIHQQQPFDRSVFTE